MSYEDSARGVGPDAVDRSRAPLGEMAATALVRAARASDDRIERHYLEIKGPIDVRSKRDGAKIAKFILGAANRTPELAASALEGYAVMIIGIERDGPGGVEAVEAMDVARSVEPYIGVAGVAPAWDLVRVPAGVEGRDILLVVVEPPHRQRRAPYVCRADGEGVRDGAVYVRADGETRLVRHGELEVLVARGRAESSPDPDFGVTIESGPTRVVIDVDASTREYVAAVRDSLGRAIRDESPARVTPGVGSWSALGNLQQPETRTQAQYEAEIDDWEEDLRREVSALPERLAGSLLPPVVVRLANISDAFLHDVELVIHLEGAISGFGYTPARRASDLEWGLPEPPRKWGPHLHSALLAGMRIPAYDLSYLEDVSGSLPSRTSWHNSGSVTLTIEVGDLRPRAEIAIDDEEVVLALPADYASDHVSGTWQITARDHHRVYAGSLRVGVERVLDLTAGTAAHLRELAVKLNDKDQR